MSSVRFTHSVGKNIDTLFQNAGWHVTYHPADDVIKEPYFNVHID